MMNLRYSLAMLSLAALAACSGADDDANEKLAPAKSGKAQLTNDPVTVVEGQNIGTPMAERVAVLGLLNKRNGQTRDIELKPGEAIRFDKVVVRLRACEKTAPWENRPDEGAFVQLIVRERPLGTTDAESWRQVFSGWLFKENPAANVVEHPIYDVWVKACKMSFPGEEESAEKRVPADRPTAVDRAPSSAPQVPAPAAPTDIETAEEPPADA